MNANTSKLTHLQLSKFLSMVAAVLCIYKLCQKKFTELCALSEGGKCSLTAFKSYKTLSCRYIQNCFGATKDRDEGSRLLLCKLILRLHVDTKAQEQTQIQ